MAMGLFSANVAHSSHRIIGQQCIFYDINYWVILPFTCRPSMAGLLIYIVLPYCNYCLKYDTSTKNFIQAVFHSKVLNKNPVIHSLKMKKNQAILS